MGNVSAHLGGIAELVARADYQHRVTVCLREVIGQLPMVHAVVPAISAANVEGGALTIYCKSAAAVNALRPAAQLVLARAQAAYADVFPATLMEIHIERLMPRSTKNL